MDGLIFRATQSQVADGHDMRNGKNSDSHSNTLRGLIVFAPSPKFKFAKKNWIAQSRARPELVNFVTKLRWRRIYYCKYMREIFLWGCADDEISHTAAFLRFPTHPKALRTFGFTSNILPYQPWTHSPSALLPWALWPSFFKWP